MTFYRVEEIARSGDDFEVVLTSIGTPDEQPKLDDIYELVAVENQKASDPEPGSKLTVHFHGTNIGSSAEFQAAVLRALRAVGGRKWGEPS